MTSRKKKTVPLSETLNLFQNNHVFFIFLFQESTCINISLVTFEVITTCAWYLHSFPTPFPHFLLLDIYFELRITRTYFDFPRKFELPGIDCICWRRFWCGLQISLSTMKHFFSHIIFELECFSHKASYGLIRKVFVIIGKITLLIC